MSQALFLCGPLADPGLVRAVAGEPVEVRAAVLPGVRLVGASDGPFAAPVTVPDPLQQVMGLRVLAPPAARGRIERWLRFLGYRPMGVTLACGPALGWTGTREPDAPDWDAAHWTRWHAPLAAAVAPEVIALLPHLPQAELALRLPMLLAQAESRLRAVHDAAQRPPGPAMTATPRRVEVLRDTRPYAYFFGVAETDLQFERHDGTLSAPVRRAGFLMADAVTVLPYDPVTDRVLLVQQFRFAPFLRHDPDPWLWEVIAGRIDLGETPEQAARRESVEEARLTLRDLIPLGGHYPSTGAVTEYVYAYVGLTDLGAGQEGIAGVASEAEDIRARVLPLAEALDMVNADRIKNGPSVISLLWLALNRDRLRRASGLG